MKRSVAILGPTPQFVRWSLGHRCQLRQLDSLSPDATFRQLRGVREFSVARSEGRVFEHVCVHPSATSQHPSDARGFSENEVLSIFGGAEAVEQCCRTCPANTNAAGSDDRLWAGCYGWLAADGSSLKDRSAGAKDHAAASAIDDLLVKESAHAIEMLDLQTPFAQTFPNTALAWFGFWQSPVLSAAQMPLLESVLSVVLRRHEGTADPEFLDDLLRFIDALNLAVQHDLPLHVELVPRGHSDGQTWTLARHCERCRLSIPPSETAWRSCPACGNQQSAPERKLKVLGLRPYVSLARVLGLERTKTFLEKYEAATVNNSPADSVNRPERP